MTRNILMLVTLLVMIGAPANALYCDVPDGTMSRNFAFGVAPINCGGDDDSVSMMMMADLNSSLDFNEDTSRRFNNAGGGSCFEDVTVTGEYTWSIEDRERNFLDYPIRIYSCSVKCNLESDSSDTYTWNIKDSTEKDSFNGAYTYYEGNAVQTQKRFDCEYSDVAEGETETKYIEAQCTYVTDWTYSNIGLNGERYWYVTQPLCDLRPNSSQLSAQGGMLDNELKGGVVVNDYTSFHSDPDIEAVQGIVTHRVVIPVEVTGAGADTGNLTPINLSIDIPDGVDTPDDNDESAAREDEHSIDKQEQIAIRQDNVKKEQIIFTMVVQMAELLFSVILLLYYMLQMAILVFVFTEWLPAVLRAPVTMLEEMFLKKGGGR